MRGFRILPALGALAVCLLSACIREDDRIEYVSKYKTTPYNIAVVLPMYESGEYAAHLETIAGSALYNMRKAQRYLCESGDTLGVDLNIEWYDEDGVDLDSLSSALALREDLLLVVGPLRNGNVDVMARACKSTRKPMIVPGASSENIIRRYAVTKSGDKAEKPFLWSLCETDVSQSEVLLAKAWESGAKSIALLTPDDEYGQTFYEWVPFLATELGLELSAENIYQYTDDLADRAADALKSGVDCLICAANSAKDAQTVLEERRRLSDKTPRILFSNGALSTYLLQMGELAEGAEGVAQYADPTTGFQIAYEEKYGYSPAGAEAQVYDALLLAGITAFVKNHLAQDTDPNEIIRQITSLGEEAYPIWSELGMRSLLALLSGGGDYVKLVGASGVLRFDSEACTSLVQSTYVHWMVYEGKLITLDYMSSDGSKRIASTLASWNWKVRVMEDIEDEDSPVSYGELEDSRAILVQGSSGWANYRHQADVLNVYRMLKRNGWDDDHIILIVSDELADNPKNAFPGEVRCSTYGEDLYRGAVIDYSTDTLSVSDVSDILLGRSSAHLPRVLDSSENTNVLLFWSGHGCFARGRTPNGFIWRDSEGVFSDSDFQEVLNEMFSARRYRKMLLLLEPCYSRNMAVQAEGIPGVLSIASAGAGESSFADFHSYELNLWMSDRFSNNLVTTLSANPGQTYKELYEYLYTHTLGSHVYVENSYLFGNLCKTSPEEFLFQAD
ncbi:MAG: C13 family peptidase [Bacteroidia bacterium]|nr:C13 family peptidase [Bacteroidia bacterium]